VRSILTFSKINFILLVNSHDDGILGNGFNSDGTPSVPGSPSETKKNTPSGILAAAISLPLIFILLLGFGVFLFLRQRAIIKQSRRLSSGTLDGHQQFASERTGDNEDILVRPFFAIHSSTVSVVDERPDNAMMTRDRYSEKRTVLTASYISIPPVRSLGGASSTESVMGPPPSYSR